MPGPSKMRFLNPVRIPVSKYVTLSFAYENQVGTYLVCPGVKIFWKVIRVVQTLHKQ